MVRYRDRHLDGALVEGDWHEVKLGVVGGCDRRLYVQKGFRAAGAAG